MAITKTQFRKGIPAIMEALHTDIKPLGIKERAARRARVKADFWFFFSHYLPHYGEDATPAFHREIIALLGEKQRLTAIAAPRGFAKSSLVSFAYVLWLALTENCKFAVLVSSTDTLAKDLTDFIRLELTDNRRILEDYGMLLPPGEGAARDFTAGKTRILALGRRMALRGFRSRQHRPDLIILDDIEKDDEALNPKTVGKILDAIGRGILPSLHPTKGRLVLVGTLLKPRSAAGTILLSDEEPFTLWARRVYRALETDTQGKEFSLWPARFPLEALQELRSSMGTAAFNAEYQNLPADGDTSRFKPQWFIEGVVDSGSPMAVFVDPAADGIRKGDFMAAVFVSRSQGEAGNIFIIEHTIFVQNSYSQFFSQFWDAVQQYKPRIVAAACEANGFQVLFLQNLSAAGEARGITLPISSIKNTINKDFRIARLAAYFETGKLMFAQDTKKTKWGKLLMEQLEYFPTSSVHDDGPDALEGALRLLENHGNGGSKLTLLPRRNLFQWGR